MNLVSILLGTLLLGGSVLGQEGCHNAGVFENFEDVSCASYIDCRYGRQIAACPPGRLFDPKLKNCTEEYVCQHKAIECPGAGLYKHPNDAFCEHFLVCKLDQVNNILQFSTAACPDGNYFDPVASVCCEEYVCRSPYLRDDLLDCENRGDGPFPNELDKSCSSYYYCTRNQMNNQVIATPKTCSPNLSYDPARKKCTSSYQCPSTMNDETIQAMCQDRNAGPHADPSDKTCKTFYYCYQEMDRLSVRKQVCKEDTMFDPNINLCTREFICSQVPANNEVLNSTDCIGKNKGPHAESSDNTCKTYYYCMKNNRKLSYTCEDTLIFDVQNKVCSLLGQCNQSIELASAEESDDELCNGKEGGPYAYETKPDCRWYYYCLERKDGTYQLQKERCEEPMLFDPDNQVCTSGYRCPSLSYNDDAECIGKGKGPFADETDVSCKTYYFCQDSTDGIRKQMFSCNDTLMYDPQQNICSTDYNCKTMPPRVGKVINGTERTVYKKMLLVEDSKMESEDSSHETRELTDEEIEAKKICDGKTEGPHGNETDTTCKSYYFCHGGDGEPYVLIGNVCSDNLLFNPEMKICTTAYACPFDKSLKSDPECIDKNEGPYREENDKNCTGYYFCVKQPNGLVIKESHKCEDPLMYDPSLNACSSGYACPFKEDDIVAIDFSSSQEEDVPVTSAIDEAARAESIARCGGKGYGPHKFEEDKECKTYYFCDKISNDFYKVINNTCKEPLLFDPSKSLCTNVYLCPTGENKHVLRDCIGKNKGPYADETDKQCLKYYSCKARKNGLVTKKESTCKAPYMFHPDKKVCTKAFHCRFKKPNVKTIDRPKEKKVKSNDILQPSAESLRNVKLCRGKGKGPHEYLKDEECKTYYFCTKTAYKSYKTTFKTCENPLMYDPSLGECTANYKCNKDCYNKDFGPHAVANDTTCRNYYHCKMTDGIYVKSAKKCPKGSMYNKRKKECGERFKCKLKLVEEYDDTQTGYLINENGPSKNEKIVNLPSNPIQKKPIKVPRIQLFEPFEDETSEEIDDNKVCVGKKDGDYANVYDETCQTMFRCSSPNLTKLKCPNGSVFDPILLICSNKYLCPPKKPGASTIDVDLESSVDMPIKNPNCEKKSVGPHRNEEDKTCRTYYYCVLYEDGTYETEVHKCIDNTLFDGKSCSYSYDCKADVMADVMPDLSVPDTLKQCSGLDGGPHANKQDPTCTSYFNCFKKGEQDRILYKKCSPPAKFNPDEKICSKDYNCGGENDLPLGAPSCENKTVGPHADESDLTCRTFYYCKNRIVRQKCQGNTKFDPETLTCSKTYPCETRSIDFPVSKEEMCEPGELHICSGKSFGPHADESDEDCELYYYCVELQDNLYKLITHKCNSTSKYDPYMAACSPNYVCHKKTVEIELVKEEDQDICQGKDFGPHKYEADDLCTMYYYCINLGNDIYKVVLSKCIDNLAYDPFTKTCSSTYICPNRIHDPHICEQNSYGPHRVQTDMSCKTYYYCTEHGPQPYRCVGDSLFHPVEKRCSQEYICPVEGVQNPESVSCMDKSMGPHADFTDLSCKRYYYCMERPGGNSEPVLQECKDNLFYNPTYNNCTLDYTCNRDLFASVDLEFCQNKLPGLYSDPKDPSCKNYYLCKTSYEAKKLHCFGDAKFDPKRNACFSDYVCPETPILSDIIACNGKSFGPHKNETDKYCGKYYYCVNNADGTLDLIKKECPESYLFDPVLGACSKTYICSYVEDKDGVCASKHVGLHRDVADVGCTRYFSCKLLSNGMYEVIYRKCPYPSNFNPDEEACVDDYECSVKVDPVTNLQVPDNICQGKEFGPHPDMFDKECKTYYYCRKSPNGEYSVLPNRCKKHKMYDPYRQVCTGKYKCPLENTHVEECDQYTGFGPHPSKYDSECKDFYYCLQSDDTYNVRKQRCNGLETFDPSRQTCTLSYKCPGLIEVESSLDPTICEHFESLGPYADPTDKHCRRYFFCKLVGSTFELTKYSCDNSETFDPTIKQCSPSYKCLKMPISEHVCKAPLQRFADPTDYTCKTYFLCDFENSSYELKEYRCKESEMYDPWRGICSPSYRCPYTIQSIGNTEVCKNSLGPHANTADDECKSYLFCEYKEGTFDLREYKCKNNELFDPTTNQCSATYQCKAALIEPSVLLDECKISTGPHEYPTDKECRTYFSCEFEEGSYKIQTKKCEPNKLFDPNLRRCSPTYKCPHSSIAYPTITADMCHGILKYYPDLHDKTCATYYMCEFNEGSVQLKQYKCEQFEAFDPKTKKCSSTYKCPLQELTQETCKYSLGPHADTRDILCKGFYICKLVDGVYELQQHKCKDFERFDPTTEKCSASYKCSVLDLEEANLPVEVIEEMCSEFEGPHLNPKSKDCSSYFFCKFQNGQWKTAMHRCPDSETFDVNLSKCSRDHKCRQSYIAYPIKSPNTCLNVDVQKPIVDVTDKTCKSYFFCEVMGDSYTLRQHECRNLETFDPIEGTCSSLSRCAFEGLSPDICKYSVGPHANPNDITCRSYYFCSFKNSEYQLKEYKCKEYETFDPNLNKCSITYKCNLNQFKHVDVKETIIDELCNISKGPHAYPGDRMCHSYFTCEHFGNSYEILNHMCTYPEMFNPVLKECDSTYQCPSHSLLLPDLIPGICKMSLGPHADPNDKTCKSYYFCEYKGDNLELIQYKCEDSKTFDPQEKRCTSYYTCPYQQVTPEICKYSLGPHADPKDPKCNGFLMCTFIDDSYQLESFKCKEFETFDPQTAQCSSTYKCKSLDSLILPESVLQQACAQNMGPHAHPTDKECMAYFYCKKDSDGYAGVDMRHCENSEIFDPKSKQCVPYAKNKCIHEAIGYPDIYPGNCKKESVHVNNDDKNCSSYFACELNEESQWFKLKQYNCKSFESFDPETKECSETYKCPYFDLSPEICKYSLGPHIDPTDKLCKNFYICEFKQGFYELIQYTCDGRTSFDPKKKRCSASHTCVANQQQLLQPGVAVSPENCRFKNELLADHNDKQCLGYFVCDVEDEAYILRPRKCVQSKTFDPIQRECSSSFLCPTAGQIAPVESVFCEQKGNSTSGPHPMLEDTSCKSYFYCKISDYGYFTVIPNTCADGQLFDPQKAICTKEYKCSTNNNAPIQETSMSLCTDKPNTGPHALKTDATCESFYTCDFKDGEFKINYMKCEDGEKYDPVSQICSSIYKCEPGNDEQETIKLNPVVAEIANTLCPHKGKGPHADESDITCSIFYFCTELQDHTYEISTGRCDNNEKYDPELKSCTHLYECPHESMELIPMDVCQEIQSGGPQADLTDPTCKKYFLCIDGQQVYQTCPENHRFDEETSQCILNYVCPRIDYSITYPLKELIENIDHLDETTNVEKLLLCSDRENGPYANPDDPTCNEYYFCYKNIQGKHIHISYTCGENRMYDPEQGICTVSYKCPHKIDKPIATPIDGDIFPLLHNLPEADIVKLCEGQPFGPNVYPVDSSCTTYYYCKEFNGRMMVYMYECNQPAMFNPEQRICTVNYTCPKLSDQPILGPDDESTMLKSDTELLSKLCERRLQGPYALLERTSCSIYYYCKREGPTVTPILHRCKPPLMFNPEKSICTVDYKCPKNKEEEISDASEMPVNDPSNIYMRSNLTDDEKLKMCKGRNWGPHVDERDITCKVYYYCIETKDGSYQVMKQQCVQPRLYDPESKKCTVNFQCPFYEHTISPEEAALQDEPVFNPIQAMGNQGQNIPEEEKIAMCRDRNYGPHKNETDVTCASYYYCNKDEKGIYSVIVDKCKKPFMYDEHKQICSLKYICPKSQNKPVKIPRIEEMPELSATIPAAERFSLCNNQKWGPIANVNDKTCTSYYYCSKNQSEYFVAMYQCEESHMFDPKQKICAINYKCPSKEEVKDVQIMNEAPINPAPKIPNIASEKIFTPTEEKKMCDGKLEGTPYVDESDATCTSYYYCMKATNGNYRVYSYKCKEPYMFDAYKKACSVDLKYKCPTRPEEVATEILQTHKDAPLEHPFKSITNIEGDIIPEEQKIAMCQGRTFGPIGEIDNPKCDSYYYCMPMPEGKYTVFMFHCQQPYIYDREKNVCSLTAGCAHDVDAPIAHPSDTDLNLPGEELSKYEIAEKCDDKEWGPHLDKDDKTCATYYYCNKKQGETRVLLYHCFEPRMFDPIKQVCSLNYKCPHKFDDLIVEPNPKDVNVPAKEMSEFEKQEMCYNREWGPYPDLKDTDCRSYYYCSETPEKSYKVLVFNCTEPKFYDPYNKICTANYQCTNTVQISVFAPTEDLQDEKILNPFDEIHVTPQDRMLTPNQTHDLCNGRTWGPHAHQQDATCSSYHFCIHKQDEASVVSTWKCDYPYMFHPDKQICTTQYICPLNPTSDIPETYKHLKDLDIIDPLNELHNPNYIPRSEIRRLCDGRVSGPYADDSAKSCADYYFCENQKVFIRTCNAPRMFDPEQRICTTNYRCPHKVDEPIEPEDTNFENAATEYSDIEKFKMCNEHELGANANKKDKSCTEYYYCIEDSVGHYNVFTHSCKLPRMFDPVKQTCTINYECPYKVDENIVQPGDLHENIDNTEMWPLEKLQMCEGKEFGPYADEEDSTCTSYYYCNKNGKEYNVSLFKCKEPHMYHPIKNKCTANYKCIRHVNPLPSDVIEKPIHPSDELLANNNLSDEELTKKCEDKIEFELNPDKDDESCTKYYSCTKKQNGNYRIFFSKCDEPRMFDPVNKVCSVFSQCSFKPNYVVPQVYRNLINIAATNPIEQIVNPRGEAIPKDVAFGICTGRDVGPHLYERDPTSKSYYYCLEKGPQDYKVFLYDCNEPKVFDPKSKVCVTNVSSRKDQEPSDAENIRLSPTLTQNDKQTLCLNKTQGPHADLEDPTCRNYYYCKYTDGVTWQVLFNACKAPRVYDPETKLCTIKYKCPYGNEYQAAPIPEPQHVAVVDPVNELPSDGDELLEPEKLLYCDNHQWGPYADEENRDCVSYYYCKAMQNGYKVLKYDCQAPHMYNPSTKTCTVHHICPHKPKEITQFPNFLDGTIVDPYEDIVNPAGEAVPKMKKEKMCQGRKWGPHLDEKDPTCSTYYYCKNDGETVDKIFLFRCPETYSFDPEHKDCRRYRCPFKYDHPIEQPHPLDVNTLGELLNPTEKLKLCQDREWGPHAKENDPTCKQYYFCKKDVKDQKVLLFSCEEPRMYDPVHQVCSIYHKCVDPAYTTAISKPIRDPVEDIMNREGTQLAEETKLDLCEGREWGPHADKLDRSCKTYYYCTKNSLGKSKVFVYHCRYPNMMYDPENKYCRKTYNCAHKPFVNFTGVVDETDRVFDPLETAVNPASEELTPLERYNMCNGKEWGPHALKSDPDCASYYFCKKNLRGNYQVVLNKCQENFMFDPEENVCSIQYVCPYNSDVENKDVEQKGDEPCDDDNVDVILELGAPSDLSVYNKNNNYTDISLIQDSKLPIVRLPPPAQPKCDEEFFRIDYDCTKQGYFKNAYDKTCRSYIFCDTLEDGKFYPHGLVCPSGYFFNPATNRCSSTFRCY